MSIEDRLRAFIAEQMADPSGRAGLTDDLPLLETGLIDSLTIFELITFMEQELGVKVGDDELVAENFGSIRAMTAFVRSRTAPVGPRG
jgi:acyl carrier protein